MNDTKTTAQERFDRMAPEDQQLANAYIDALHGMTDEERALVQQGYEAVMASEIMQGKSELMNPAEYARSFMEIVIRAGQGNAAAWGIIRETIREAQEAQEEPENEEVEGDSLLLASFEHGISDMTPDRNAEALRLARLFFGEITEGAVGVTLWKGFLMGVSEGMRIMEAIEATAQRQPE